MYIVHPDETYGRPSAATIGFFDGVHRGHHHLFGQLRKAAAARGLDTLAVTFGEHPRQTLAADYRPHLLTTKDEKLALLDKEELDACAVLRFDKELAALTAREFMERYLRDRLGVRCLVIGYDHHFGSSRGEGFVQYAAYGRELAAVGKADNYNRHERCCDFCKHTVVSSCSFYWPDSLSASLGAGLFYMTRPSVAFIKALSFPPGYELPEPGNILKYRMTDNAASASLVITAPDAAVPVGVDAYLFGREPVEGETPLAVLGINEGEMWRTALDGGSVVLLYEESSVSARRIAEYLKALDSDIAEVTYTGRISGANMDSVKSSIPDDENTRVLLLTPSSSMGLLRSPHSWRAVLDIRDAAAMETTEVDMAVSIDWDNTIENLLSGTAELSYRLISL